MRLYFSSHSLAEVEGEPGAGSVDGDEQDVLADEEGSLGQAEGYGDQVKSKIASTDYGIIASALILEVLHDQIGSS